jgi:hypothetical protein
VNRLASTIRGSAELDAGEWMPDWDDVLQRADVFADRRRPARLRAPGALFSKRVIAIVGFAALALVLTAPGLGVGGRLKDLISGSQRPGLGLRAGLVGSDGRQIGSLSLRTSRLFVQVSPRTGRVKSVPFLPRGRSPLPQPQLRWTLQLDGGTTAASARIEGRSGKVVARLCSPCSDGEHGTIRARRGTLAAIFAKPVVVVQTGRGPARGILRLQKPLR